MKNLFFTLAFMLIGTASSFASTTNKLTEEVTYEYTSVINSAGLTSCYVRVCWNESETSRKCTEWQEVPCGVKLELEGGSQ